MLKTSARSSRSDATVPPKPHLQLTRPRNPRQLSQEFRPFRRPSCKGLHMTLPQMNRSRATALLFAFVILGGVRVPVGQELQIGIIDFYGLNRVSAAQVREALTFKERDTLSLTGGDRPAFLAESEDRLSKLPGVVRARTNIVCCDQGRVIVFVGIQEDGAAVMRFRAEPRDTARLAADIVQAGDEFSNALMAAVQRGDERRKRNFRDTHSLTTPPCAPSRSVSSATLPVTGRKCVACCVTRPTLGTALSRASSGLRRREAGGSRRSRVWDERSVRGRP